MLPCCEETLQLVVDIQSRRPHLSFSFLQVFERTRRRTDNTLHYINCCLKQTFALVLLKNLPAQYYLVILRAHIRPVPSDLQVIAT